MGDALRKCFSEARLNGLTLRNRLIKAATFEGKSPGGIPGTELIRFHELIGQGGVAMTTLAYCAAEADGRITVNTRTMARAVQAELRMGVDRDIVRIDGMLPSDEGYPLR